MTLAAASVTPSTPDALSAPATVAAAGKGDGFSFLPKDGLSFWDLLDVVNPLQHIPIVNGIYREITGDTCSPAAKLAGGTLFGGLFGLAAAGLDVTVEGLTGKDLGGHAVAMVEAEDDPVGTAYREANDAWETEGWSEAVQARVAEAKRIVAERAAAASAPSAESPVAAATAAVPVAAAETQVALAGSAAAETDGEAPQPATAAVPAPAAEAQSSARRRLGYPRAAANARAAAGKSRAGTSQALGEGEQGREFAAPARRSGDRFVQQPISAARAGTRKSAPPTGLPAAATANAVESKTDSSPALPAGLSAQAVAEAGLSPESVSAILAERGERSAAISAVPSGDAGTAAASGLWFQSEMNRALDKYREAQSLGLLSDGAPRVKAIDGLE